MAATLAMCVLAGLGGCGSSATNSDFRTIQIHEATIAASGPRAWDGTAECKEACAAAETTCDAADDLCDVARGKHDDDASARCDTAESRCDRAESASDARCHCD